MPRVTAESSDEDHLTMEDLICYSFQVAKGMEFLSSRKVKLRLYRNLCTWTSNAGDNNRVSLRVNVTSCISVCSAVYPPRSSGQKHPALREQCGEDL